MNLILLGKPGAGKGFIADILKNEYGFYHISTGALLRKNIAEGTQLGQVANGYMAQGELVPNDLVFDMLKDEIGKMKSKNCVFDGYPRSALQAKSLADIVNIDSVLFVDVPDDILIERVLSRKTCLACGNLSEIGQKDTVCKKCGGELVTRADDNLEVVTNRLNVYNKSTAPLKEFYADKIVVLDNSGSVEQTKQKLNQIISDLLKKYGENI